MITNYTSDLASNLRMSERGIALRSALEVASQELASGQKADITQATQGAVDTVFAIDRKLENLDVYAQTLALAEARSTTSQGSLGIVNEALTSIGVDVLAAMERDDLASAITFADQSRSLLNSVVGALNTQVGGQSLFAGAGVDRPAIDSADAILSDIAAIVAAAPDAITAINDINTYFNDPAGGFATNRYLGATVDAPTLSIADGVELNPLVRADDQALRDGMRILAVSAVIAEGGFAGDPDAQKALLSSVAQDSIGTRDNITFLRQKIGHAEGRIAETSASNSAEKSTLQITRNNLTSADPYEVATRVSELQTQLESLYLLTARLSGLSLTSFLR